MREKAMKKIIVEQFPDGSFADYDGNGRLTYCRNPLDACDRSWCLFEHHANPNKAEGAVLVEYEVTATPTGRNPLYRHGQAISARFHEYNTEGYTPEDLEVLNSTFEAIMSDNADAWATELETIRDRDIAYKSWQDAVAETLLYRYDSGERGDSLRGYINPIIAKKST